MKHFLKKNFDVVRRGGLYSLLIVTILSWINCPRVHGQEYPSEITNAVVSDLQLGDLQFPLQTTELPGLREQLITLEQDIYGERADLRLVRFYAVTPAIYTIVNGKSKAATYLLGDDNRRWLIGIGPGKVTYKLAGFQDSASDFNRLMADVATRVNGPDVALDVFSFYLKTACSQQFSGSVVIDSMQLQSVSLLDFRMRVRKSKRLAAFNKWWAAVPASLKKAIEPPKAQMRGSDFIVSYYRYDRGAIKKESLYIAADGSVRNLNVAL